VVQHPLDDSGRLVLVAAVSLVHGTLVVVGDKLGLAHIIIEIGGRAVAPAHPIIKRREGSVSAPLAVLEPDAVLRPKMVVAEHLAHVLHAGDGLAGPYLGCETE